MQTRFTIEQLTDPDVRDAERTLRKCVHCGFCTATCPTYVLLGDELDSPRGRIYLIKEMLEQGRPATEEVVRHIDRCLSCLACVTTCPSGVDYQHLIDHARMHVERTYRRPLRDRLVRAALAALLPYPRRFAAALRIGVAARPVLVRLPGAARRLAALLPPRMPAVPRLESSAPHGGTRSAASSPARRPRVAVLEGCVESVLAPRIHAAALRLLEAAGADPVSVGGCCGALVHHLGRVKDGGRLAADLLGALDRDIDRGLIDAVVSHASGCGTHVKDYGYQFRNDPKLADAAARVAERTGDVSELLLELGLPRPARRLDVEVAYHSACSMQHGQKVHAEPRTLLEHAGFVVKDIAEGHLCCGSAGTYNLLQPEIAAGLRDRKLANIERTGAAVVATGNIGCIAQLASGSARPVVHTLELLDWALGGPCPPALEGRG